VNARPDTGTGPPAGELYAWLDGLRGYLAAVLADDTRDPELAVEWAVAELTALCQQAPAWCPGCPGRGTGTVCRICAAPVPAALRRRRGDPSGLRASATAPGGAR
jgi:hypothetical protein